MNYEEEAEVADEFDSDFDEDVSISWLSYGPPFCQLNIARRVWCKHMVYIVDSLPKSLSFRKLSHNVYHALTHCTL